MNKPYTMQHRLKRLASYSFISLLTAACIVASGAESGDRVETSKHTFTFGGPDNTEFLLDGQPFQIIGGEMHPARIPREYWRHRIRMARAMGINTIPIYVFWNQHEEEEGKFDFTTGERNIGEFFDIARQEGMWVILRAGPYACGEWDFGGLPWWLLRTPDIKLRCSDPRFTAPVARYFHELAKVVRPRMAANGGPILMVQLENEYGSYPRHDHDYMVWLRDLWIKEGIDGPFLTADGAGEGYLKGNLIPGVAVGLDEGYHEADYTLAHKLNSGVPVMSSEVYPGWLRHWGEGGWAPSDVSGPIKFFMDTRKSFSLYVFHGGSNFGFTAGSNGGNPSITSYDYGAPLNEQGRTTPAYFAYRKLIGSYLPPGKSLPDIPAPISAMYIPPIRVERWSGLWDRLPHPVVSEKPEKFEALGQNQGIVIYRTRIPAGGARHLSMPMDGYPTVYLDGALVKSTSVSEFDLPACNSEATLEVLVQGMGHINFTGAMEGDRKGLGPEVRLAGAPLNKWEMMCFPLKSDWMASLPKTAPAPGRIGGIFKGQFTLDTPADTYLDMSAWKKGMIWVNGHNLGYYWSIGPQQRLYCPAPWLKTGVNTVMVLDNELTEPQPVEGFVSPTAVADPIAGRMAKAEALAFDIDVPANTVKTKDMPWPVNASVVAAHIDPMGDEGQSWGVGLALGWTGGKYVQINARKDGNWDVRCNGGESVGGSHAGGKPATVVLKLTNETVEVMAREEDSSEWSLVSKFPRSNFPGDPTLIRFGKIGAEWQPRDFSDKGASNPCRVDWVKAY